MHLIIHSNASYLTEWDGKSNCGVYFCLVWNQRSDEPPKLNGAIYVSASLPPLVAISIAKAKLGGTFYNAKKVKFLQLPLKGFG